MSIHSYPSVYALGHRAVKDLLPGDVLVEEKVDGSQLSWCVKDGEVEIRSKGAKVFPEAAGMFDKAVETILGKKDIFSSGWTYRAEYLRKPKHNALAYDRVPTGHLIIFDIDTGEENYLTWDEKAYEAGRVGLEVVPRVYEGHVADLEHFRTFLDRESILGGQKIEGVVVKPLHRDRFGLDKKLLVGKYVSEAFKEVHAREWKQSNPQTGDVVERLVDKYKTPARWDKAVLHLQERGLLEDSPRDIGKLIVEVGNDVEKECREEILDDLWKWIRPLMRRRIVHGLPEWYKEQLLKKQFEVQV